MLGCFYEIIYVALQKCLQALFTFFFLFFVFYYNLHKINSAESLCLIFFSVHFIFIKLNISSNNILFIFIFNDI